MKGYIHVYTGGGKGKTTAALGLALRAAGAGMTSFMGQFLKGQQYSELKAAELLRPFLTIEQFGRDTFVHVKKATPEDRSMAQAGLERMKSVLVSGAYSLVIFDEINVAVALDLLAVDQVLQVLALKPKPVEVVLTGRAAPQEFIDAADLVTEMKEIKHYYQNGTQARIGIEK